MACRRYCCRRRLLAFRPGMLLDFYFLFFLGWTLETASSFEGSNNHLGEGDGLLWRHRADRFLLPGADRHRQEGARGRHPRRWFMSSTVPRDAVRSSPSRTPIATSSLSRSRRTFWRSRNTSSSDGNTTFARGPISRLKKKKKTLLCPPSLAFSGGWLLRQKPLRDLATTLLLPHPSLPSILCFGSFTYPCNPHGTRRCIGSCLGICSPPPSIIGMPRQRTRYTASLGEARRQSSWSSRGWSPDLLMFQMSSTS